MAADNIDFSLLRKQLEEGKRFQSLHSGGGGSTFDPMEHRVAQLERQFEKTDEKVGALVTGLAVLTERVSHLPTKGFIVTTTVTAMALFAAVVLFKDNIAALFAAG